MFENLSLYDVHRKIHKQICTIAIPQKKKKVVVVTKQLQSALE